MQLTCLILSNASLYVHNCQVDQTVTSPFSVPSPLDSVQVDGPVSLCPVLPLLIFYLYTSLEIRDPLRPF